jgi:hypothetical protein
LRFQALFRCGGTMWCTRCSAAASWQFSAFRFIAIRLYPKAYRFKRDDLIAFDLGFAQWKRCQTRNLHRVPLEDYGGRSLAQLRRELGVDVHALHAAYRVEAARLPHTEASRRLDKDYKGVDPSDLQPPDAGDSDWQRSC